MPPTSQRRYILPSMLCQEALPQAMTEGVRFVGATRIVKNSAPNIYPIEYTFAPALNITRETAAGSTRDILKRLWRFAASSIGTGRVRFGSTRRIINTTSTGTVCTRRVRVSRGNTICQTVDSSPNFPHRISRIKPSQLAVIPSRREIIQPRELIYPLAGLVFGDPVGSGGVPVGTG